MCFVYFSKKNIKIIFRNSITRFFNSICIVFSVRKKVNLWTNYNFQDFCVSPSGRSSAEIVG